MKKTITFLSFFLSLNVFGQISITPVAGINNTRYVYSANKKYINPDRNEFVPDFRIGAIFDVPFDKHVSFQPGMLYSRNSQNGYDPSAYYRRLSFNISALEMPFCIAIKNTPSARGSWFVAAGLFWAINLGGTQSTDSYDQYGKYLGMPKKSIKIDADIANGYRWFCVGIKGEAGYSFKRGSSLRFFVQDEYTNLVKNPVPSDFRITRFNYGLVYGYTIPLKKKKTPPPPPIRNPKYYR